MTPKQTLRTNPVHCGVQQVGPTGTSHSTCPRKTACKSILIFGVAVYLAFALASSATERAQPLTRADCEEAGKAWNETANVCGDKTIDSNKEKKKKKGGKHKKDQSRLKEKPPEADSR
jgi:hypothetical protein